MSEERIHRVLNLLDSLARAKSLKAEGGQPQFGSTVPSAEQGSNRIVESGGKDPSESITDPEMT